MVSGYSTATTATTSSASTAKFDQVVRGDVKICKIGEQKYKITFMKEREFTLYQVWTPNGNNTRRLVLSDSSKRWQERLIAEQKRTGFAPTTLMAVGDCKWAFVITNAYFEKSRLVLEVSTAEIVNLSKTVQKGLKTGYFKNARFDIDGVNIQILAGVNGVCGILSIYNIFTSKSECENYYYPDECVNCDCPYTPNAYCAKK